MKTLYDLYRISKRNEGVIIYLLQSERESYLKKLFIILQAEGHLDDNTSMLQLYGERDREAFSKLKAKMREVLIRTISLQKINVEPLVSRADETHNQFRNVLVAKILNDLSENNLSIEIAEKTLAKSIKYHITEIILIIVRMLIRHFGASEYNHYKLNKYLQIQEKYLWIHSWEVKAENFYIDLQKDQLKSLASPHEITIKKSKKYVDELNSVSGIETYLFYINKYKVEAAYYEYIKDYDALLLLSNNTIKLLRTPELRSKVGIQNINIRKIWALIQAGRNSEAIILGEGILQDITNVSLGWFIIAHYVLKAELYNGNYINAIPLITQMINHPKFKKIGPNYHELFYTTLGYIYLITESELFGELKEHQKDLPEFKLYKFLNTIPVFSKDKRGINVSILLMHIAFLLQRKDYNAIIDRVDSLNQYAYRYLRKDDSFRSNCMIKMVIQMTKADFNPIRTERYTQDLLHQLEQVKLAGSGENIETEIIPYEVLWKIMTKAL